MAGVAASGNIFFQTGSLDICEADQFTIADNVTNKQQWAIVVDINYPLILLRVLFLRVPNRVRFLVAQHNFSLLKTLNFHFLKLVLISTILISF